MAATIPKESVVRLLLWNSVLVFLFSSRVCLSEIPRSTQGRPVSKVYADSNGRVHVLGGADRGTIVPKEKEQESVEQPLIAGDGRTVGWLVNFPNCCTSYPIPTTIVLYRDGHIIHQLSNGRAIFKFQFVKGGERLAYLSDTVHGNLGPECVLVNVRSGKTLDDWTRGNGPLPAWAEVFAADVGPAEESPKQ